MVARTWWVLVILALMMALPALAQVTVLKSGTVIAAPSKNTPEHRARQAAAMKGAMSGRYLGMPPAQVPTRRPGTSGAAPDRP